MTSKSQAAASVQLIARMQKHSDLVEKNILRAEKLLIVDAKNVKKQHEKEVSDKLGEAEGLLNELFLDVDKVKKTNHPQIRIIEMDVIQLQERWQKCCSSYQDIYKQIDVSSLPKTASGPVVVQDELSTLFRKMMGENNQINMFDDDSLVDWTEIDKGGFGSVYKARHKKMGHDLAIKILHDVSVEESLLKEATFQKVFSCNFVLRTYGMYRGIPPNEKVKQQGIVMEFMTRGSLMDLCKNLQGPPPFPLACRLIQEVASGMRFLHSMGIMHRDLKLQNVMLSEDLHAKLADFGLCTMSVTCCPTNEEGAENSGTLKYTPPEAYDINYKPVRSFDVYSFAIFLWAVLSGEEPFPNAPPPRLRRCVAEGQRPTLAELSKQDIAGMKELLDLMKMCWNGDPTQRPTFKEITPMVEKVYSKHKSKIFHKVYEVVQQLETGISDNLESSHTPKMDEKDKIHERDSPIHELQQEEQKEEDSESENISSPQVTIYDQETDKEISRYEADMKDIIGLSDYMQWQKLACEWEELSYVGPDSVTFVMHDRKSGKQYAIKDAIKEGKITEYDLQQYRNGNIHISEFAPMVAGDVIKQPQLKQLDTGISDNLESSHTPKMDEKDKIHELQQEEQKEEDSESKNISSPKVVICDPETGKEFSLDEAYMKGIIDRSTYIVLQEYYYDWEEVTSIGPDGETSVMQDHRSGKQYSIKDAIKEGWITEDDLQQYKNGNIPISEFALMVAGVVKKQPQPN